MKEICIAGRKIGAGHPPFVIAEMSGNHNGSLDRALEIAEAACDCGVDALKLQTYTADTLTLDLNTNEFFISDPSSLWKGKSMHELYREAYTPWDWHRPIMDFCRKKGVICFSTPFDFSAVDFLEELSVPAYKIASPENIDIPLIQKVSKCGKPLIISTGMASAAELEESVSAARRAGASEIALLKCTSSYPAKPEQFNLSTIPDIISRFGVVAGLSDHSMGDACAIASVPLGASIIEKHFTLRRADGGPDSAFSMEPLEMKRLVENVKNAWIALGSVNYGAVGDEKKSMIGRRSLYVSKDIEKGETFTAENIRSIRPGLGLPPKFYYQIIGRTAAKPLSKGTALVWDMILDLER